jgi:hypothetical protein
MARITKPPQFSFDDSLIPLNRRQDPLTQTQRGNYEWTWAQARCWQNTETPTDPTYEEDSIQIPNTAVFTLLMFGSDVPQLAFYIAEEAGQAAYTAALLAFFEGVDAWTAAINAWGVTVTPALSPIVNVPAVPSSLPVLCLTRADVLIRPPTLTANWGTIVDAGQGSLVSVTYNNAGGVETFAQGFPLYIADLSCVAGPNTADLAHLTITVGYESQLNHGVGFSAATGGTANPQTAYTPIILRRQDYSPAIYAAGNVIVQGNETLFVVGLWDLQLATP